MWFFNNNNNHVGCVYFNTKCVFVFCFVNHVQKKNNTIYTHTHKRVFKKKKKMNVCLLLTSFFGTSLCPEDCLHFFDGCNDCQCGDDGSAACTKKGCAQLQEPRCIVPRASEMRKKHSLYPKDARATPLVTKKTCGSVFFDNTPPGYGVLDKICQKFGYQHANDFDFECTVCNATNCCQYVQTQTINPSLEPTAQKTNVGSWSYCSMSLSFIAGVFLFVVEKVV